MKAQDQESIRLEEDRLREKNWKRWGPYLAERQWSTVREDYSADGSSWDYFPHEHARSRAYRWGEDGLLGITDRECRLCFALALWNGKDPILKERPFGLTSTQGNHGEDVKEYYFYLDSTPTHSYMKALYKYPQKEFPYDQLVLENKKRGLLQPEYELLDTGIFAENRYFDVYVEYAKQSPNDILIRITIENLGPDEAPLHLLPTLWFRNTWIWGCSHEGCTIKPTMHLNDRGWVEAQHQTLEKMFFAFENKPFEILFTDNHTNQKRLYNIENIPPYVKDAFHRYVVHQEKEAVNPSQTGTKCAPVYAAFFAPGEKKTFKMRLFSEKETPKEVFGDAFDAIFQQRIAEADAFYAEKIPSELPKDEQNVSRQAYAGLLWNKQFYHYVVKQWLGGDPEMPQPPEERKKGRNNDWKHAFMYDVISMPDKWEYPWFAAWDLSFHMIPFATIDPDFAKKQMVLFLREWYMHPNGQIPAYEYNFSDVNPPVHAWAAWRIYKITGKKGKRDRAFLESVFQKMLLNFTWWVNRKDIEGNNLFSGGFLGLDNIGVFDRSKTFPSGGHIQQADGTGWMAFFCLTMLTMALELSSEDPVYEDLASKFFEHFVHIADALNELGGCGLWDEKDGFYYDLLKMDGNQIPLRTRSVVGLLPLIAVEILEEEHIAKLPGFSKRLRWFLENRQDLEGVISYCRCRLDKGHRILAIPSKERLERLLRYLLDENEFLSPFGIRSLSKFYEKNPYAVTIEGQEYRVDYVPGEGNSYLFGGNSNWRGPIWFPINYLIIEALERYHYFFGDEFVVECPVGSGIKMNLKEVAQELTHRLCSLFVSREGQLRVCHGNQGTKVDQSFWKDHVLFHEYFHAETGKGLGASHQTGWTALVSKLFQDKKVLLSFEKASFF